MESEAFLKRFDEYEDTPMRGSGRRRFASTLFKQRTDERQLLEARGRDEIKEIDNERHELLLKQGRPENFDAVVAFFMQAGLCELCKAIPVVELILSMQSTEKSWDIEGNKKSAAVSDCRLCEILWAGRKRGRTRSTILPVVGSWIYFQLLNRWLDCCHSSHKHVMPSKFRPPPRLSRGGDPNARMSPAPKRLIYVGIDKDNVRLIEGESKDKIYVALSHRWGPTMGLMKTTTENVEERKNNLDLDSLPQTFQDAVTTTRGLGIRYLWIDSLCIVQNDNNEVAMECRRMELIFSQAYCVIAATFDHSPHYGFLSRTRHEMNGEPFLLPNSQEETYLRIRDADANFSHDVLEQNLHTRGWVFQERALALHTIHFATSQAYWECDESIICESQSGDFATRNSLSSSDFPPKQDIASAAGLVRTVKDVFSQYSRLNLSNPMDRPTAILALEYRLAWRGRCVSLCGILGQQHLQETLIWKRSGAAMTSRIAFPNTSQNVPSWSWMSRMGGIDYVHLHPELHPADIEFKYEALPSSNTDTGGGDATHHYQLLGKLYTTQQKMPLQGIDTGNVWTCVFVGGNLVGLVSFDELDSNSFTSSKFLEVVIVWSGQGPLAQDGKLAAEVAVRQLAIVLLVEREEEFVENEVYYHRIGVGILDKNLVQLKDVSDIRII